MIAHRIAVAAVAVFALVPLTAQETHEADVPEPVALEAEQPCLIDERLSLWLSLESVDRMIAALEQERRDLASELATAIKALDVLDRADRPDGVEFTDLSTLVGAKAVGQDAIRDSYAELQGRLTEIDKTLKRRYRQQAALEAVLEASTGESGR